MGTDYDVVVVGAGPAGLSAAIECSQAGAHTLLLDEHNETGGQYFRPRHPATARRIGHFRPHGRYMVRRALRSGVEIATSTSVWGHFDDKTLELISWPKSKRWCVHAKRLVIATGAYERHIPFRGWTMPGVVTAGFALHLATIDNLAVGRRVVVAGSGPFLPLVATELIRAGACIVEVVEAAPFARLLRLIPPLMRLPSRGFEALLYLAMLLRRGVPYQTSTVITAAYGEEKINRVHLVTVTDDGIPIAGSERTLEIDALCVSYGFSPSNELVRLLGCNGHYSDNYDSWIPQRSEHLETTIPGVYVVGEAGGIGGAHLAIIEGLIGGLSAAASAGHEPDSYERRLNSLLKKRRRLHTFSHAVNSAFCVPNSLFDLISDDVIICRCEGVTAGHIRDSAELGLSDLNALKRLTRATMGICQGRMCTFPVTRLIARSGHLSPSEVPGLTARNPLRPMPIENLIDRLANSI